MAITDVDNTKFSSTYDFDKIIRYYSGSVYVPAPPATPYQVYNHYENIDTGLDDYCFAIGIFSIDGGTTWNDSGVNQPKYTTGGQPIFQTQSMTASMEKSGELELHFENWSYYDGVTTTSAAYTFMYRVILIARSEQAPMDLTEPPYNTILNDYNDYEKIHIDRIDYLPVASSTTGTLTITHGLGYVPLIKSYWTNQLSYTNFQEWDSIAGFRNLEIDDDKVVYTFYAPGDDETYEVHTRIYYDY